MCLCVCVCTYRWCCAALCGPAAPAARGCGSSDLTHVRPQLASELHTNKESTRDLALGVTKEVLEIWKNKKAKSKETKDVEETGSKKKIFK
ncbi:uncharacterized protein LOC125234673 isoform X2 [Leguminivora glycinivorella]|nr:uncharacterized protein LOC125234673 isoform X2 [Leguminivora glycinivorella]